MAFDPVNAPWPQLAAMAQDLRGGILTRIVRAGMRQGLTEWRDKYVPLRFSHAAKSIYGFSNRSAPYAKRRVKNQRSVFKGSLPDYVYTGKFRDSLLKRKPRTKATDGGIATGRFSIFGGAVNLLGQFKGSISEVTRTERITETVKQHRRSGHVVRSHRRTGYRKVWKTTLSPKTYAEEWAVTASEKSAATAMVDAATRRILSSARYMDPKTGRFRQRYMREELINA
jgi:hypothetical protein